MGRPIILHSTRAQVIKSTRGHNGVHPYRSVDATSTGSMNQRQRGEAKTTCYGCKFAVVLTSERMGSKSFYKRISGRQTDHSASRLTRAGSSILSLAGTLADKMAAGWVPIVSASYANRTQTDWVRAIGDFCGLHSLPKTTSATNEMLVSSISSQEVAGRDHNNGEGKGSRRRSHPKRLL